MRLLIDECCPKSTADAFAERGHEVIDVRSVVMPGTPDAVVARVADDLNAIVVTWNIKDFSRLAGRARLSTGQRLRNLGYIAFKCREVLGAQRVRELAELIEFEFEQNQRRPDRRMVIRISTTTITIVR